MRYKILEKWRVLGKIEKYETEVSGLKAVKKWIEEWIEGWKIAVEEPDKIVLTKTDYKTFAYIKVKTEKIFDRQFFDTFNLKVVKV